MYDFNSAIRLDSDSFKDFSFHETYDHGESFFLVSTHRGDTVFNFRMNINSKTMDYEIFGRIPQWIKELEQRLSDVIKRELL